MPLISIIVPVYNTEKYLRRCIDSILAQTFTDFECILIDDGSTDNSGMICDEFAGKDERIRVIHQKNQGISNTRNLGLSISRGDYITFVDSDDFISEETYKMNIPFLQNGADIVQYPYITYPIQKEFFKPRETIISNEIQLLEKIIGYSINYSVWNKIFRKEIFANNKFRGIFYEDMDFYCNILESRPTIKISDNGLYYYRRHTNSITLNALNARRTKEKYDAITKRALFVLTRYPSLSKKTTPALHYWCIISIFRELESLKYRDSVYEKLLSLYYRYCRTSIINIMMSPINIKQKAILFYEKFFGLKKTMNKLIHK